MKLIAKINSIKTIAENTVEAVFEIPNKGFTFKAGQYVSITLPSLKDMEVREQFRDFSVVSSPDELPRLSISFRKSASAFKTTLLNMKQGDEVIIEGPKGIFTLPEGSARPLVFIAGGVGIDPFHSMLKFAAENGSPHKITLVYFNKNMESAAYLSELNTLPLKNANIDIINVFGPLEEGHILNLVSQNALWYVAGPPGLVKAARGIIEKIGIIDADIKTEEFAGY